MTNVIDWLPFSFYDANMMNMNGVTEMYGIQNTHGRYYAGDPRAYFWSKYAKDGREWATEAEASAFKKEHKIRGKVVKLEK